MIRGIYTSASGMLAETLRTDVISNNLANVNTAGYKKDVAVNKAFSDILINRINDGEATPIGGLGLGTAIDEVATDQSAGMLRTTGNDFDLAVDGKGFFVVNTPNGVRYTRNGSFGKNAKGELITQDGYQVMGQRGPIVIKNGGKMTVSDDGRVLVDGVEADKLQLVDFANEKQLTKEGASLYNGSAAGTPQAATGGIRQGALEMSNVNVVSEMVNLISNFRAYEVNSKAIVAYDGLLGKAANDVGKVG